MSSRIEYFRRRTSCGAALATALLAAACAAPAAKPPASAPANAPSETARTAAATGNPARAPRRPNYVDATALDVVALLPPAPQKGSVRYESDRRMFKQTRRFKDTPRWVMATKDADAGTADMLQHFSCALNVELTPTTAPQIAKFASNLSSDAGRITGSSKDHYKRLRPYLIDKGEICRPRDELGKSFDYPSGHTIAGWAWASALAQVVPDRATPILARGRAYGESRIVCGVHNVTAVDAGRLAATAVAVMAQPNAQYQSDLAAARTEFAALQKTAPRPAPARCTDEAALVALSLD